MLKKTFLLLLLFSVALATDFNITNTTHFDAGTKSNVTTITNRYNQTTNTLELDFPYAKKDTNLVSYWRFENNANDETKTNNGTLTTPPTFVSSGQFDGAYDFDGDNDVITVTNDASLNLTTNFTLASWVYIKGDGDYTSIISKGGLGTSGEPHVYYLRIRPDDAGQTFQTFIMDEDGVADENEHGLMSTTPYEYNEWMHFASTYDGDKLRLYVNGSLDATSSSINQNILTNIYDIEIGRRFGGGANRYFNGTLDEMKVYNKTLNSTEVTELFNNGNQYKTSGTWESENITMPENKILANMTINYTGVDSNNYINKIEWLIAGETKATLTDNINSGTSATVLTPNTGSFENVNQNFSIKLYLVGNGTHTPSINLIGGFYENYTSPDIPYVRVYYTDASYDEFELNIIDWQNGTGNVESTFTYDCSGTGTAYTHYYSFDVNETKVIDEIHFYDPESTSNYQITAVTLEQ